VTLTVDVLTLFPDALHSYAGISVLGRARDRGVWNVRVHDVRDVTTDVHRSVDDTPYGGGAGMVLSPEPLALSLDSLGERRGPVIALTPAGTPFRQARARELARESEITLICGRYEGFDQRFLDSRVDEEISVGDFVLAGGELAALCVLEAVVRLLPGALGNADSVEEESFSDGLLEYPHYTKPAVWRGREVPDVLLSGDHGRIARWRRAQSLRTTLERRPDLLRIESLSAEDRALLEAFAPVVDSPSGDRLD
jgi:tRNA (guanine37-N1)-methyltransferase